MLVTQCSCTLVFIEVLKAMSLEEPKQAVDPLLAWDLFLTEMAITYSFAGCKLKT